MSKQYVDCWIGSDQCYIDNGRLFRDGHTYVVAYLYGTVEFHNVRIESWYSGMYEHTTMTDCYYKDCTIKYIRHHTNVVIDNGIIDITVGEP